MPKIFQFKVVSSIDQLNWVCNDAYKARIGQSLFFLGSLMGTFTFGVLGDRIGRVRAVILANQCGFVGDFLTTYASNLVQFAIFRCISGLAATANYYLMFILGKHCEISLRISKKSVTYIHTYNSAYSLLLPEFPTIALD